MKRHTLAYLFMTVFIGLTMISFVVGSLPRAAAATLHAPVGLTETFTPPPTNTSVPAATNTPVPADTNTPVPAATNTPVPADTNTPVPANTNTPVPAPTNTSVPIETSTTAPVETSTSVRIETNTPAPTATSTPTAPTIIGFPNTGGVAPRGEIPPWILLLAVAFAIGLGWLVFKLTTPTR